MRRYIFFFLTVFVSLNLLSASNPMQTSYSFEQCCGSLMPYISPVQKAEFPDSLVAVMINYVGRHGSRYPASASHCRTLLDALERAETSGTITTLGRKLKNLVETVIYESDGRWGALDSLGTQEMRAIASRMYLNYPEVFSNAKINAISSYSPRCMMSMYDFTHQLDRLDNKIEFATSTGRQNSILLRPFDTDIEYKEFIAEKVWAEPYNSYFEIECPLSAISRVLGKNFEYQDTEEQRNLAITEYYVIASTCAMSLPCNISDYFTKDEYNSLWSCFNLRQYLQRTSSTLSTVPSEIAAPLLLDIVQTTENFISGASDVAVQLRFGHAETLLPLLSLMHLPGCYYMTNYFDTVGSHWQDFNIVPLAANLQIILFKNINNGRYYIRVDLNEKSVSMIPNNPSIYIPWETAKNYMIHCVPIYLQP